MNVVLNSLYLPPTHSIFLYSLTIFCGISAEHAPSAAILCYPCFNTLDKSLVRDQLFIGMFTLFIILFIYICNFSCPVTNPEFPRQRRL